MNRRRRIVSIAASAFLLSGAVTLALSWRLAHVSAAQSTRVFQYVAPAHLVDAGQALQPADVHLVAWPTGNAEAVEHLEDAVGRTTLYPLAAGQPVLEHDLTPRGAGPGLAGRIPNGMRALAVRSDEVVGVGGFLSPGLHVDMLVTLQDAGLPQTTTVLQDAEVIAVGQQAEPDPSGKPTTATVVTLLLTPDQAERALLSSSQGTVHFVLRNSADRASTHNPPVTLADLRGGSTGRSLPSVAAPAAQPVPQKAAPAHRAVPQRPAGPAMPEMVLAGHNNQNSSAGNPSMTLPGLLTEGKR